MNSPVPEALENLSVNSLELLLCKGSQISILRSRTEKWDKRVLGTTQENRLLRLLD